MYLLSINNMFLKYLVLGLVFFVLQIIFPKLLILNGCRIGIDFVLIFLTISIFKFDDYKIILLAFIFGLLQDFIINVEQIGIMCFLKSFSVYLLGLIKKYQFIWNFFIKYIVLFLIAFLNSFIYYLFIFDDFYFFTIYVSILNSFLFFIIMFLINKYYFNLKLI